MRGFIKMGDYLSKFKLDNWKKVKAPSFKTVINAFTHYGYLGDEINKILLTICYSAGQSLGIISSSGSGKSKCSDTFVKKLVPEGLIYTVGSSSKTAIINNYRKINTKKGMYVTELQKLLGDSNEMNLEMLKTLLEGKKFTRPVNRVHLGENEEQFINPLPLVFTVALENSHKEYNEEEFCRRGFLYLTTDISKELTEKVIDYKLKNRFKKERLEKLKRGDIKHIKEHIKNIFEFRDKYFFENPFAEYFVDIIPSDYLRVRSILDNYLNIMESSASWFQNERLIFKTLNKEEEKDEKIFLNLQDIYNAKTLYHDIFINTLLQIPFLGKTILKMFEEGKAAKKVDKQSSLVEYEDANEFGRRMMTVEMLHRELKKERKLILTHTSILAICNQLCHGNYLEKERIGSKTFFIKTFDTEVMEDKFDLKDCWKKGCELMKKEYPEYYKEWKERQLIEGRVILVNPLTEETFDIQNVKDVKREELREKIIENPLEDIENGNNSVDFLFEKYGEDKIKVLENTNEIIYIKEKDCYNVLK